MATRILFSLHLVIVASAVVGLLSNVSAANGAKDLIPTPSSVLIGMKALDACSENCERAARYETKNQTQRTTPNISFEHAMTTFATSSIDPASNDSMDAYSLALGSWSKDVQLPTLSSHLVFDITSRRQGLSYWHNNIQHVSSFMLRAVTASSIPVLLLSIFWLYFSGSFFFDLAHWTMHKCSKSKFRFLRNIGYFHEVHHMYFNRRLKFNNRYRLQNMYFELPLELSCQLFGTWLGYLLANLACPSKLSKEIMILVLIFETIRSFVVACMEGRDSNHKSYAHIVPKDPHTFLVGPEYHALHHVDPSSYIGSTFKVFDWFLGTSCSLQSRRATIAGELGSFSEALKRELLSENVSCVEELQLKEESRRTMLELLTRTDILIIGTELGSDEVIDLFKTYHKAKASQSLLLPEVWHFDELRKASSRQVKSHHDDEDMLYRHVICGSSPKWIELGPRWTAKMALWWIKRGVRTVPATFDFLAFFGYINISQHSRKERLC